MIPLTRLVAGAGLVFSLYMIKSGAEVEKARAKRLEIAIREGLNGVSYQGHKVKVSFREGIKESGCELFKVNECRWVVGMTEYNSRQTISMCNDAFELFDDSEHCEFAHQLYRAAVDPLVYATW